LRAAERMPLTLRVMTRNGEDSGFRIQDSGFRIQDSECWILNPRS